MPVARFNQPAAPVRSDKTVIPGKHKLVLILTRFLAVFFPCFFGFLCVKTRNPFCSTNRLLCLYLKGFRVVVHGFLQIIADELIFADVHPERTGAKKGVHLWREVHRAKNHAVDIITHGNFLPICMGKHINIKTFFSQALTVACCDFAWQAL